MTDKSEDYKNSDSKDFFGQFSPEEREEVKKMWEASKGITPRLPEIQQDEIDDAFSKVNNRIDSRSAKAQASQNSISDASSKWKWMAAAAVILLIAGAGFLTIPKTIYAPKGEIITTSLPDGSTVDLNSGSELRYNRLFSFMNRKVELNGEAFFSVNDGEHPFVVEANNATIKVTGTEFNVRSWSGDPGKVTEVTVSEGTVQFYREDARDSFVTITPGRLSRLTEQMEKPTAPEKISIDRILGWRDHKLVFNDQPLIVIFRELERRFDVRIQIENSGIGQQKLSTYYADPRNIEWVLNDICRVKGLNYAKTADGYRIYK